MLRRFLKLVMAPSLILLAISLVSLARANPELISEDGSFVLKLDGSAAEDVIIRTGTDEFSLVSLMKSLNHMLECGKEDKYWNDDVGQCRTPAQGPEGRDMLGGFGRPRFDHEI